MSKLPFDVSAELKGASTIIVRASVNGTIVTSERLQLGNGHQRRKLAELWAADARLWPDSQPDIGAVVVELERVEADVQQAIEAAEAIDDEGDDEQMDDGGDGKKKESMAFIMTRLCLASGAELWHTPAGDCYASTPINEHSEHWPTRSKQFRRWLTGLFFLNCNRGPSSQATQDAIATIEAVAHFKGKEHSAHVRVAEHDGAVYLDLADSTWRAVRVTPNGWSVIADPPVKFRRAAGMLPLPAPEPGGSLNELRDLLNVGTDGNWILIASWLMGAVSPCGPYPLLCLNGEQGAAKSAMARLLRSVIDPNEVPLRSAPRDEQDLAIAANNGRVINLDNLSGVQDWLSDALCRISTGGGFGTRHLYTNFDEALFNVTRPIVVNGISELATRSDLLDRALTVALPTIHETKRRLDKEIAASFRAAHPRILGALLDAVSCAMGRMEAVKLDRLPRMADFARWVVAAEPALPWKPGAFMEAYVGNRAAAHELAIEASVIGAAVRALVKSLGGWSGTASELLETLNSRLPRTGSGSTVYPQGWPKKANTLSGHLRRIAPNLRETGVSITTERDPDTRAKIIRIESKGKTSSASFGPSAEPENRLFDTENASQCERSPNDPNDPPNDPYSPKTALARSKTDPNDPNDPAPLLSTFDDPPIDDDFDARADAMAERLDDRQPVPAEDDQ